MKVDLDATQPRGLTSLARSQGHLHGSREISVMLRRQRWTASSQGKAKAASQGNQSPRSRTRS
jgi:hypothetical protein